MAVDISTVSGAVRKPESTAAPAGAESCRGPAASNAKEWDEYRRRLRCAYCHEFIPHDEKGRLRPHERPS